MKNYLKRTIIFILVTMTLVSGILPNGVTLAEELPQSPEGKSFEEIILADEANMISADEYGDVIPFKVQNDGYYQIGDFDNIADSLIVVQDKNGVFHQIEPEEFYYINSRFGYKLKAETVYYIGKSYYEACKQDNAKVYALDESKIHIEEEGSIFSAVEAMIAWMVRTTANGLIALINWAVGGEGGVTIDKIIFNHYLPTRLDFFSQGETDEDGEEIPKNELIESISNAITTWFNNFRNIAIAGYLAILLYVAIQVLWKSTGKAQADFKRQIVDWVVGVALLFLFPYMIQYSIELNNILVSLVEQNKGTMGEDGKVEYVQKDFFVPSDNSTKAEKKSFTKLFDDDPFAEGNTNYMALMARKAAKTERLSYAIVYLIMAWQLLMIIIAYYKRVFMVAFLLVLLPVVALTYAVDKVKDGKSQAFDVWGKEILVNIFIQTFHAIVYVFTIGVVFQSGENNNDWMLMIMGVSFLFKGEEIIKSLFGLKADTVESLGKTALKTMATYQAVKAGAKGLMDNTISKNSHFRRSWAAHRNAKTYQMMANNFDKLASTGPEFKMPSANLLAHAPSVMDAEATELGNAIQIVNHRDMASPKELALAIDKIQKYYATGGKHAAMLNDLNIDKKQLDGLQKIKEGTLRQLKAGVDTETITQNIKIELETLFPTQDVSGIEQALYQQMASPLVGSNHLPRNMSTLSIQREIDDAKRRRQELDDSIEFSATDGGLDIDIENEAKTLLFNAYHRDVGGGDSLRMARNIAMVKQRGAKKNSSEELMAAMDEVWEHQNDSEEYKRMAKTLDGDVDELRHVLAEKTLRQQYGADYRDKISKMTQAEKASASKSVQSAMKALDYYENSSQIKKEDVDEVSVHTIIRNQRKIDDAKRRRQRLNNSIKFSASDGGLDIDIENEAKTLLFNTYHRDVEDGDSLRIARNISMLNQRGEKKNSSEELMAAMDDVWEHQNDSVEYRKMVQTIDGDVDELRQVLAEKTLRQKYGVDYRDKISKMTQEEKESASRSVQSAIKALDYYDNKKEDLENLEVERIKAKRNAQNSKEADLLHEFSNEVRERVPEVEALYNGMTREDILEMEEIERSKSREELARAGLTTGAALTAAPFGAAAGIAFLDGDGDSPISEGIAGASAAMAGADAFAERAIGITAEIERGKGQNAKTRKIVLQNPYTGEDQEVEITYTGALNEKIYSYNDPILPQEVSARIREQFLDAKIQKQKAEAAARKKKIDDANKKG